MRIIKTALAVCLLVGAIGVAANAEPVVAVGPNVQVSASHPTEDHFEFRSTPTPRTPITSSPVRISVWQART